MITLSFSYKIMERDFLKFDNLLLIINDNKNSDKAHARKI